MMFEIMFNNHRTVLALYPGIYHRHIITSSKYKFPRYPSINRKGKEFNQKKGKGKGKGGDTPRPNRNNSKCFRPFGPKPQAG